MKTKLALLGLLLAVLHGPLASAESSVEAVQQALKGLVEDESQIGQHSRIADAGGVRSRVPRTQLLCTYSRGVYSDRKII